MTTVRNLILLPFGKYLDKKAEEKEEYLSNLDMFISDQNYDKPILFEVFTNTSDESEALETIQKLLIDKTAVSKKTVAKIAHSLLGTKGINVIKSIIK